MQYQPFLRQFKKLYHLVGTKQDCELVKQVYEKCADDKNFQFVISEQLGFQYKPKYEVRGEANPVSGGVLKSYWLDKVLEKEPMVVVLVFNISKPLDALQKWQDRLQPLNIEANKARQYLRNYSHKRISLCILVLTPNNTQAPLDKIKQYTRVNDRTLQIIEFQTLRNEIKRIKTSIWQNIWQKSMDERIKKKSKQEGFKQQTKLKRFIKLAILKQIGGTEDSSDYDNAYILCKQIHYSIQKNKDDDINTFITKLELRFLGDILLLKGLKSTYKADPQQAMNKIKSHFYIFRQKDLEKAGVYFYYQQLYWRSQFMIQLASMILSYGMTTNVENKIGQIVKGIISYNIQLSKIGNRIKVPQKLLERLPNEFYGRLNYKITDQATFKEDFKNTRIGLFIQKSQSFLWESLKVINELKETKKIKKHEQDLYPSKQFSSYLDNLEKSVSIYNSIVDSFEKKSDFLVLNCLLKEFEPLLEKNQHHAQLVKFYLVAIKVLDYFNSHELLPQFVKQLKATTTQIKALLNYDIPKDSSLIQMKVDFQTITSLLSDKIKINLILTINQQIKSLFTSMTIKFKKNVAEAKDLQILQEQILEIEPSDFMTQEDIVEIQEIAFKGHNLVWSLKGENLVYLKKNKVYVIMPMNDPVVKINTLIKKVYVNQAIPIQIKVLSNNVDTKVVSKIFFNEEKTDQPALCFQNPQQPINLIGTQTYVKLSENTPHIFYMKFPKQGDRKVTAQFRTQLIKTYTNSKGQRKQVTRAKKSHQQLKFVLEPILTVSKRLTIPGSELLTKKIEFKQGVYKVPINQNIMIQYNIVSQENIVLTEIKQTQLDQNIKFIKSLDLKDIELEAKVSYKIFSIIQVKNSKDSSQLPPLLLKWRRKNQTIQNIYIDSKQQITTKNKSLSIQFKESDIFKKGDVGSIHYRISNHMQQKAKIRIEAMETDQFIIVGKNKTQLAMPELSHCTLTLKIIPLCIGQILLPQLLIRMDEKLQAKLEKRHIAFAV